MDLVIDTNVLVYATLEDSEKHKEAKKIVLNNRIFIPRIVLIEYIGVLLKIGVDKEFIEKKIREIIDNFFIIPVTSRDIILAFKILKEENKDYKSWNDKIILACALNRNLKLITYDKELRKEWEKSTS